MSFEKMLNGYKTKACVMSVEKYSDGSYGNIRIAAGNKAHCDEMLNVMHRPFIPDSPYEEYLPQHKNFEDFCFRSAFLGQPLHSYVSLPQMGLWLNMFLLPLESDKENTLKKYCTQLSNVAPNLSGGKIMGPIAAQIYQIRNWYRMRFLVSGDARANLQPIVRNWLSKIKQPANVRIKIDVNPQNFM